MVILTLVGVGCHAIGGESVNSVLLDCHRISWRLDIYRRWRECKPVQVILIHFVGHEKWYRTVIGNCKRYQFIWILVFILCYFDCIILLLFLENFVFGITNHVEILNDINGLLNEYLVSYWVLTHPVFKTTFQSGYLRNFLAIVRVLSCGFLRVFFCNALIMLVSICCCWKANLA